MDREQALDTALGQIERQFGKGSVMRMPPDEEPAGAELFVGKNVSVR